MNVEEIQELRYTKAIETYLKKDPHNKYVEQLFDKLDDFEIGYYIYGGAIRNPIASQIHERDIPISDIDILIDDSKEYIDLEELLREYDSNISKTSLGSPRWTPEDELQIDIVKLSNATILKHDKDLPISLETTLTSCDFTPSAIAYDPEKEIIYSYGAIEAINNQEIELLYIKNLSPATVLCNLILKSEKMKFHLGPKAKTLIIGEYSPDLDQDIINYMLHKGAEEKSEHVIDRLQEIQNSAF